MIDLPDSIAATLALWWRRGRAHPWRLVARGTSSQQLTDRAAELPSGDVITLPIGEDPNLPRVATGSARPHPGGR